MDDVIVWGLGQMGAVFAHGLLRAGHTVHPVTRETDLDALAKRVPEPALVLVAVGEADLADVIERMPAPFRERAAFLQNELLPNDLAMFPSPTIASVWFEKKKNTGVREIMPTPIAGPGAALLSNALATLGIGAEVIDDADLLEALVAKNLYILVANIGGLGSGTKGTVEELLRDHAPLVESLTDEVLLLQEALAGAPFRRERAIASFRAAIDGDPNHGAMGRSAPARLQRALAHAKRLDLTLPTMEKIQIAHGERA